MAGHLVPMAAKELARRHATSLASAVASGGADVAMVVYGTAMDVPWLAFMGWMGLAWLLVAWRSGQGAFFGGEARHLDGEGRARMQACAARHPEVAQFVREIKAQGREVVWGDLWRVNGWLGERREKAERAHARPSTGVRGALE